MSDRDAAVDVFGRYARAMPPDVADLVRRAADDQAIMALLPANPTWDVPHRLTAAVDWLIDIGAAPDHRSATDPWAAFRTTCLEHGPWVRDFVRDQRVQTNEVQRCYALLPIFLTVARASDRPLDLVELGASAGLNLLWDRYRYRYAAGTWGPADADLELTGDEHAPVDAGLLRQRVRIRRRVGIDLHPLDVSNDDHVRLLRVFAAPHRHDRLLRAIDVARRDPPELIEGDYLDLLPELLASRDQEALMVVVQTLSAVYLPDQQRTRLWATIDAAGGRGPLAYVWTPTPEEHGQRRGDHPVELATWPGPDRRIIARMENHGEWIEWVG